MTHLDGGIRVAALGAPRDPGRTDEPQPNRTEPRNVPAIWSSSHPTVARFELAALLSGKSSGECIFTSPEGGPLRHSNFYRRHFRPAVERAGLPDGVRFHDLRHTCVGFLIAEGAHPKAIMERMGHSSITVALDHYGHLLPSLEEHLTEALNRSGGGPTATGLRSRSHPWRRGGPA